MKIGYKIGGSFDDVCDNARDDVQFEIVFPYVYASYEEAKKNVDYIKADMVRLADSVVIQLYENGKLVETIQWDEYWKYVCSQRKEASVKSCFVDSLKDYEPCSMKFEDIFKGYTHDQNVDVFNLQYLAYWIEPTIIEKDSIHNSWGR